MGKDLAELMSEPKEQDDNDGESSQAEQEPDSVGSNLDGKPSSHRIAREDKEQTGYEVAQEE